MRLTLTRLMVVALLVLGMGVVAACGDDEDSGGGGGTTTAKTDEECRALLTSFKFPFKT